MIVGFLIGQAITSKEAVTLKFIHHCKMWLLTALFIVHHMVSAQLVRYVKPSDYSLSCPGQPCLTLEQYAEDTTQHFITGVELKFLAGNHSLQTGISLKNMKNVALRAEVSNSSDAVRILCTDGCSIWCDNITNLIVDGLMFSFSPRTLHALFEIVHGSMILMYSSSSKQSNVYVKLYTSDILLSQLRVVSLK